MRLLISGGNEGAEIFSDLAALLVAVVEPALLPEVRQLRRASVR